MLRGSGLGAFFGALPGTSGGMATFLAYAMEKRLAREPQRFGRGAIEGIAAPEACNNAGVGTAFIPTLTLGIPGDAVMALLLAALTIQGIQPGPQVIDAHPELFWGLIVSFWIGNVILVLLNIPLIGLWVRLLSVPYWAMFPAIVLFTCIGVYSTHNNVFDVIVLLVCGLLGYALWWLRLEVVPLLLGFILGPMLEEHLRRALLLARGDWSVFLQRPIAACALAAAVVLFAWTVWSAWRRERTSPPMSPNCAA
jgi:TctA family transporter